MRFAYSPASDDLRVTVQAAHAEDLGAGRQWLGLIDGSMLAEDRLAWIERKLGATAVPVLAGTLMAGFGRRGPQLIELPVTARSALGDALRMCSAVPALSFIVPGGSVNELKRALRWLAWAVTDDGVELHCRFADTRVTPLLLDALSAAQRAGLSRAVAAWYWPDRQGGGLSRQGFEPQGATTEEAALLDRQFALSSLQYARMLHGAEADMVFQMLAEHMPELVPQQPGGVVHRRLESMLAAARARGLADLPDLYQFAVVALSTSDAFDQHPALAPLWPTYTTAPQGFGAWAQQWPEEVWQALGEPAPQTQ